MEKIYGMHKLVGLQLFWSRTPNFSSGTPTFCQMGVLNSCFQNSSESSVTDWAELAWVKFCIFRRVGMGLGVRLRLRMSFLVLTHSTA